MPEPDNIDDELLSAYLDNELAPDERARVDKRLAADPAARQLLEQLRAVSHVVKDLPPAPLGADIRDTVLRRAERAMLISNPADSDKNAAARGAALTDTSPRFTIGRSIRGWVWAGIATAAALAIMAFESNSNRDDKLPDTVAQRRTESADRIATSPEREAISKPKQIGPSILTTPAPPASATAPVAAAPAAGLSVQGGNQDVAQNDGSGMTGGGIGGGNRGVAFDDRKLSTMGSDVTHSDSANTDLLVVRVQVRPESFDEHAFDRVLRRNGIAIDEPPAESLEAIGTNRMAKDAEASPTSESSATTNRPVPQRDKMAGGGQSQQPNDSSAAAAPAAENTDVVLVEAPAAQIQSCLEEIHKNDRDYLGVAVEDQPVALKQENANEAREPQWQQYSRGIVPQQQTLQRAANYEFYFSTPQGVVTIDRGSALNVGAQQQEEKRSLAENATNLTDQQGANQRGNDQQGRAVRMRSQTAPEVNQRFGGASARALRLDANNVPQSNANSLARSARDGEETLQEKPNPVPSDSLQVLFILSAGDQPATPPAVETKAAK
jgi:anti-sigma factor RsiW